MPPHRIGKEGILEDALVNEACVINGKVKNSVLFSNVKVEEGAEVCDSVLLNGSKVKAGVKIYNCVVAEDIEITENIGREGEDKVYLVSSEGIEEE